MQNRFGHNPKFNAFNQDILKLDLSQIGKGLTVVGNIPYYLSNALIHYLVSQRAFIQQAYLTFQFEFGRKLIAKGGKDYTFLTVFLRYYAETKALFTIPASAFSPRPKVKSLFLLIDFSRPYRIRSSSEDFLWDLLRILFSQRRKKIFNGLKALFSPADIKNVLGDLNVSADARPEQLDLEKFIELGESLYSLRFKRRGGLV